MSDVPFKCTCIYVIQPGFAFYVFRMYCTACVSHVTSCIARCCFSLIANRDNNDNNNDKIVVTGFAGRPNGQDCNTKTQHPHISISLEHISLECFFFLVCFNSHRWEYRPGMDVSNPRALTTYCTVHTCSVMVLMWSGCFIVFDIIDLAELSLRLAVSFIRSTLHPRITLLYHLFHPTTSRQHLYHHLRRLFPCPLYHTNLYRLSGYLCVSARSRGPNPSACTRHVGAPTKMRRPRLSGLVSEREERGRGKLRGKRRSGGAS